MKLRLPFRRSFRLPRFLRPIEKALPWLVHPEGRDPTTLREHIQVLLTAAFDLPRAMRVDATVEMAAGMTFFLMFSLFPGLLFLVSLLPYLPVEAPLLELVELMHPLLPDEVYDLLVRHLQDLLDQPRQGILTVSAAITLFSASRALMSLSRHLNRAGRVSRLQPEFLRRLKSMGLTVTVLVGILLAVVSLSLGDRVVALLIETGGLPLQRGLTINAVRWPVLLMLSAFLVQQLYSLLPDERPRWKPWSSGAFVAVLGWVIATWVFTSFATRFVRFNVTYGSLGTAAVIMAWMYLGSLTLMVGGSLNALVDRGLLVVEKEHEERGEREDEEAAAEARSSNPGAELGEQGSPTG
jgi:membrane protein